MTSDTKTENSSEIREILSTKNYKILKRTYNSVALQGDLFRQSIMLSHQLNFTKYNLDI